MEWCRPVPLRMITTTTESSVIRLITTILMTKTSIAGATYWISHPTYRREAIDRSSSYIGIFDPVEVCPQTV